MGCERMRQLFWGTVVAMVVSAPAASIELPVRDVPPPPTTGGVPHVQLGVAPVPALSDELLRRIEAHPAIEIRPTIVSMPGALGFWITDETPLARGDVIVRGREFAHVHPDGSLHASLSPELAAQAVATGWAVPHPWAHIRPGWEGFRYDLHAAVGRGSGRGGAACHRRFRLCDDGRARRGFGGDPPRSASADRAEMGPLDAVRNLLTTGSGPGSSARLPVADQRRSRAFLHGLKELADMLSVDQGVVDFDRHRHLPAIA